VRTLDELLGEVERSFASLDRPRASQRHRGLAAMLDGSYATLASADQAVFERLSVFAGGFTRASAADACAAVAPPSAVDATIDLLVHKSLVRAGATLTGTRYSMLDTIRRYGTAKLAAAGREPQARAACASAVADLVDKADDAIAGPLEETWVATLDDERVNILAAHGHLIEHEPCRAAKLVRGLYFYAFPRGHDDIRSLAETTLPALTGTEACSAADIASAYGAAADHVLARGDVEHATALVANGLTAREDDPYCLGVAGDIALFGGKTAQARANYEAAADAHQRAGRAAMAAWLRAASALALIYAGLRDDGLSAAAAARGFADAAGCPSAIAFTRYVVAEAHASRDDAAARDELVAAVALADSVNASYVAGLAHLSLATLEVRIGSAAAALDHYAVLLDMWRKSGNWVQQWNTLRTLIVALTDVGRHDDAVRLLGGIDAHAATPRWGDDDVRLSAAERACRAALGADRYDVALAAGRTLSPLDVLALAADVIGDA
jgi:tetratricopeptide (TPR) repeat protein